MELSKLEIPFNKEYSVVHSIPHCLLRSMIMRCKEFQKRKELKFYAEARELKEKDISSNQQ